MQTITTAKIFKNGNSQAIRLPLEFRFEGDEVLIYREGGRIILQSKSPDWEAFFFHTPHVTDDFMQDRHDSPPQERELF